MADTDEFDGGTDPDEEERRRRVAALLTMLARRLDRAR
jgi:hypothetical protein